VFIDESPLFFRDTKSGYGIDEKEVEANTFASELLMPEGALRKAIRAKPFDANDDAAVRRMAARFGVSAFALTIRLTKLGLISA
jgi:Zn-dependent peptidase ImmA (M78 family)